MVDNLSTKAVADLLDLLWNYVSRDELMTRAEFDGCMQDFLFDLKNLDTERQINLARVTIPTDTMEQQFQTYYRRGFEAGRKQSDEPARLTFIKADRGYELQVLRAVQDVQISIGKACELLRDYMLTGKEGVLPEWQPDEPAATHLAIDTDKFMNRPPCYICGYNGPGYFNPDRHPCAAHYHAAVDGNRNAETKEGSES